MADKINSESSSKLNDCISSWLLFILVAGIIVCTGVYIVKNIIRSPQKYEVVIRVETPDSTSKARPGEQVYYAKNLDSLFTVIKCYEAQLDEKYEYLLENREEEDHFKTWGALIVSVIVSLCGFWGYKSMKDLREDIKSDTRTTSELTVNNFLDKNLQPKVDDALTHTMKSEIIAIIKSQVMDTLNSPDDPIVRAKVKERIESDDFEKSLKGFVREKVVEVVEEMTNNFGKKTNSDDEVRSDNDSGVQFT